MNPRKLLLPGIFLPIDEKNSQKNLGDQDRRDTDDEFQMKSLMADQIHTDQTADAAAQSSHGHESGFRDPPAIVLGLPLVHKHKKEAQCIDYKKIEEKIFHKNSFQEGFCVKMMASVLMICLILSGCAAEDVMETIGDEWVQSAAAPMADLCLQLPEEAALPVAESENASLYQCDGYEILLQTMEAGNLDATLRSVTGYGRENLTVLETRSGDVKRYDFVWSCLGEVGEQVGRACILDDGNYHYVLTVLADADRAGEFETVWSELFGSYALG